jgi:hypothetical protein
VQNFVSNLVGVVSDYALNGVAKGGVKVKKFPSVRNTLSKRSKAKAERERKIKKFNSLRKTTKNLQKA